MAKHKLCKAKKTHNPFNIPNYAVRDFQRKRVYTAEECCSFWQEPVLLDPQEVINIVEAISKWANINQPRPCLEEQESMSVPSGMAFAAPDLIFLPIFAWNKPFICHEMAHVISYQKGPNDHHGPNFIKTYLSLIKSFMGPTEQAELLAELSRCQVQVAT